MLPLLPLAIVGTFVGARALDVFAGVAFLVGMPSEDVQLPWNDEVRSAGLALGIATDVVLLVLSSLVLRWLTRRWVRGQGPDPRLDELRAR